jgi:serralysin
MDGDGKPDYIMTYTYDAKGQQISLTEDFNTDGQPDSIISSTYDGKGNITSQISDYNADGKPDYIVTYTYALKGTADNLGNSSKIDAIVPQSLQSLGLNEITNTLLTVDSISI